MRKGKGALHVILVNGTRAALAAATSILVGAGFAHAGFTGFEVAIDAMDSVNGFIDLDDPSVTEYADLIEIPNPPAGSFIEVGSGIPGVGEFVSGLIYGSNNAGTALFTFAAETAVAPFADNPFGLDLAISAHQVIFTSEVEVVVSLIGSMAPGSTETAHGFLDVVENGIPSGTDFSPMDNPILEEIVLGPGTHSVAFGVAVSPEGGFGAIAGTIAFTAVPAPGAVALLGLAGLVAGRRRR